MNESEERGTIPMGSKTMSAKAFDALTNTETFKLCREYDVLFVLDETGEKTMFTVLGQRAYEMFKRLADETLVEA